jgi:PAS domain S-box-containing protein
MDCAVDAVAKVLGNECAKVLELLPGEHRLLLKAGVGWKEGLVGRATVEAERESQAGYTLLAGEPVIVEDVTVETRFRSSHLLRDHGLVSGIGCPIFIPAGEPYGVLSSHSQTRRQFSNDDAHFLESVANILGSAIQRERSAQTLRDREERLSAIVETAADAIITIDSTGTIESFNSAAESMFGYSVAEAVGCNVSLLMPSPYREQHDRFLARYRDTGARRLIGRVRRLTGMRKDRTTFPMELSVSEIDHTGCFAGIIRDVSAREALQIELLTASEAQQLQIGQDLHDDVGQELTGLGLTAETLLETLQEYNLPEASIASRIVVGLRRTHEKVRLLSHGLVPVEIDAAGLMSALAELSARVEMADGVRSAFDCPQPVTVADNRVATNLFRIAQEAVTNAVRHARARHIRILLTRDDGVVTLEVRDDGIGISDETAIGSGLRIMRHRAELIGANFRLEPAPGGGTRILCTIWEMDSDGR